MEMTEREKEIMLWALSSYHTFIISQIVSREKSGKIEHNFRKIEQDIAQLLKGFDE